MVELENQANSSNNYKGECALSHSRGSIRQLSAQSRIGEDEDYFRIGHFRLYQLTACSVVNPVQRMSLRRLDEERLILGGNIYAKFRWRHR